MLATVGSTPAGWTVAVPGRTRVTDLAAARAHIRDHHSRGATRWLESFDPWSRDPREALDWANHGSPH